MKRYIFLSNETCQVSSKTYAAGDVEDWTLALKTDVAIELLADPAHRFGGLKFRGIATKFLLGEGTESSAPNHHPKYYCSSYFGYFIMEMLGNVKIN